MPNTLQVMINITCLRTELPRHAFHGATPLIITQLNRRYLVSMETEGDITPLFFDGAFIISIFVQWFFKTIETIKYVQLRITLEAESKRLGRFLWSCSLFREKRRGHRLGEWLIFRGRNHHISSPAISRTANLPLAASSQR